MAVLISREVQDYLNSIYLHEIADGNIQTPIYNDCISTLQKLDNPVMGYLRKKANYPSWARDNMLMVSIRGYDFGFHYSKTNSIVTIEEVFKRIMEDLEHILSLIERIEHLHNKKPQA